MAQNSLNGAQKVVVIGGSAGSLHVILYVLAHLRADLTIYPSLSVLHRKNDSDSSLSQLMAFRTDLPVKEADDKEAILPGNVYLAPADYHLLIETGQEFLAG
jgi:two-component system chemotaxis response regulator CheB